MEQTIFIEGILGSGKSSLAYTLLNELSSKGIAVKVFPEHDVRNPIDMTRKAILRKNDYERLCEECCDIASHTGKYSRNDVIKRISSKTTDLYGWKSIAYFSIYFNAPTLMKKIESLYNCEVCNGNIGKEEYFRLFFRLFSDYTSTRKDSAIHVFEGAFFQNILFDLIAFYLCEYDEIRNFYTQLLSIIGTVDLYYIKTDSIESTLEKAARHREKYHWLSTFSGWLEHSPWGALCVGSVSTHPIQFCRLVDMTCLRLIEDLDQLNVHWFYSPEIIKDRMENETCLTSC